MFLHADSEDSDQTEWMPMLIYGCTCYFVGFVMRQLIYASEGIGFGLSMHLCIRSSHFLMHAISFEPCMQGF